MAMKMMGFGRTILGSKSYLTSFLTRSFSTTSLSLPSHSSAFFLRFRPLVALPEFHGFPSISLHSRTFATHRTTSSLNDPSPNFQNRPPKETILLDGCDFEHWLIVMDPPDENWTRDEIIDYYIKTFGQVVGSEEEARMKIYSVSTRCYFAFGALVSEETSYKFKGLPKVRWVLPDSYLDVKNKNYGGEPFINGEAVPYDPKYHEEWIKNNSRANERSRRNDRPRNFDQSRNFERRRENQQNRDFPMPNRRPDGMVGPASNVNAPNMAPNGGLPPRGNFQNTPNVGNMPPNVNAPNSAPYVGVGQPNPNAPNMGGMPPNQNMHYNAPNPNMQYTAPNPNMQYNAPNTGGMPLRNAGHSINFPNAVNYQYVPNGGGAPYPNQEAPGFMPNRGFQNGHVPNGNMGGPPSGDQYQVRDVPGRDQDYQQ